MERFGALLVVKGKKIIEWYWRGWDWFHLV